jgi:hypothetical protein
MAVDRLRQAWQLRAMLPVRRARWFAVLVAVLGAGCLVPFKDKYFRTDQPEVAFQRATAATVAHCGGVLRADDKTGVITSQLRDAGIREGLVGGWYYRCVVTVLPDSTDGSASVRVVLEPYRCGTIGGIMALASSDQDEIVRRCEAKTEVPDSLRQAFDRLADRIEQDVFRR